MAISLRSHCFDPPCWFHALTVAQWLSRCEIVFNPVSFRHCCIIAKFHSVAHPGFGSGEGHRGLVGGTGGLGNGSPPAGSRGVGGSGGGIASRKLIADIKDIWLSNHAKFCVFSSTAQPGIFSWTQFRGRAPGPPGCATDSTRQAWPDKVRGLCRRPGSACRDRSSWVRSGPCSGI